LLTLFNILCLHCDNVFSNVSALSSYLPVSKRRGFRQGPMWGTVESFQTNERCRK